MFKRSEFIVGNLLFLVLLWVVPISVMEVQAAEQAQSVAVSEAPPVNAEAEVAKDLVAQIIQGHNSGSSTVQFMRALVPVVAIVMVFGMPVLIVASVLSFKHKRRQLVHQNISQMIEKGMEIPEHLLASAEVRSKPGSALRTGMVLLAAGLGVIAFFYIVGAPQVIGLGLIPLLIGLAYLLVWKLEGKGDASSANNRSY